MLGTVSWEIKGEIGVAGVRYVSCEKGEKEKKRERPGTWTWNGVVECTGRECLWHRRYYSYSYYYYYVQVVSSWMHTKLSLQYLGNSNKVSRFLSWQQTRNRQGLGQIFQVRRADRSAFVSLGLIILSKEAWQNLSYLRHLMNWKNP